MTMRCQHFSKLNMFNQGVSSTLRPDFIVKKVIPIFNNFHIFIIININVKALEFFVIFTVCVCKYFLGIFILTNSHNFDFWVRTEETLFQNHDRSENMTKIEKKETDSRNNKILCFFKLNMIKISPWKLLENRRQKKISCESHVLLPFRIWNVCGL